MRTGIFQRLSQIEEVFKIVQESLERQIREAESGRIKRSRALDEARTNLETTYLIRLFSGFEAELRKYLALNDPAFAGQLEVRAVTLINRAAKLQSPKLDSHLLQKVHLVREYRNALVHQDLQSSIIITFREAPTILNTFLSKLR